MLSLRLSSSQRLRILAFKLLAFEICIEDSLHFPDVLNLGGFFSESHTIRRKKGNSRNV